MLLRCLWSCTGVVVRIALIFVFWYLLLSGSFVSALYNLSEDIHVCYGICEVPEGDSLLCGNHCSIFIDSKAVLLRTALKSSYKKEQFSIYGHCRRELRRQCRIRFSSLDPRQLWAWGLHCIRYYNMICKNCFNNSFILSKSIGESSQSCFLLLWMLFHCFQMQYWHISLDSI